jgi:rod shape determining protein RodA
MSSIGGEKRLSQVNWAMLLVTFALLAIGTTNLYSATVAREGPTSQAYINQIYWILIGMAGILLMTSVDYRQYERFAYVFYLLVLVLLIAVAIKGKTAMGGRRWLSLGFIAIQPSEFMKLAIILALAKYLNSMKDDEPLRLKRLLFPAALLLVPFFLIIKQPDLGTAIIICMTSVSVLLFARLRIIALITVSIVGSTAFLAMLRFIIKPYQKRRLEAFLNPQADLLGSGYHANQSMIAVGSGKGMGKGFMGSTQSQFSFLPEQHTDFIFSVFSEEWGFFGVLIILALFFILMGLLLETSRTARDKFGLFASIGVFFLFFWHILINVGMVSGMLPVVGVTLPFFSAGGSSMITMMLGTGIAFNIHMRRQLR